MKIKTKIWALPVSAALVFGVSIALSYRSGTTTAAELERLRSVESPHQALVAEVDRRIETFRLTLQSAAAEGDASKLDGVEKIAASVHEALASDQRLDGKADASAEISSAFAAYQRAALGATRAMLGQGQPGDDVKQMQSAQAVLSKLMDKRKQEAADAVGRLQSEIASGVQHSVWLGLITGGVVLLVLGVASHLTVTSVWRDLGDEPGALRDLMQRIAAGHLASAALPSIATSHPTSLRCTLAGMSDTLQSVVTKIRDATDSIGTASGEIAAGNADLSTRTEHTASNLQQTASAMEQFTRTVRQSRESADQANQLATQAQESAQRGGTVVAEVVQNMSRISAASRKINEITSVIDSIAFQTNILALNAAVEAARAGEQGRGFAVVASEVRTLAKRSADAASEIKSLIAASSRTISDGSLLVQDTGNAMREIVAGVTRVSDIIASISAAAAEQTDGIEHVNHAVINLDQMTQQNAALVEQSAAAAESLRDQSAHLSDAVATFQV